MAKKGFPVQSQDALDKEMRVAEANDDGKKNVHNRGDGYSVSEQSRRLAGYNDSLQSVGTYLNQDGQEAVLTSSIKDAPSGFEDRRTYITNYRILAHSSGKIELMTVNNPGRYDKYHSIEDVTKILSNAGITAADIRQMQKNIAYDGEVDRSEQQKIIDVVNTAQRGLGDKPHR